MNMNTSAFTIPTMATQTAICQQPILPPVPPAPPVTSVSTETTSYDPTSPAMCMADQLFAIAKEMLYECKNMVHPDYPDITSYHKDFEMRWKHATDLITTATKLVRPN